MAKLKEATKPKTFYHGLMREGEGIVPWKFTKRGAGLIVGVAVGASLLSAGVAERNRKTMGPMTYADGPMKMTRAFNRGTMEAMERAANGDERLMGEMFVNTMKDGYDRGFSKLRQIENYGVDSSFLSAFYNMRRQ